jgi:hypothetical protein
MPLYPIPVIIAIAMWLFIFISTGVWYMLGGMTVTALGMIAWLFVRKRLDGQMKNPQ